ncbi:hypothetical protein BIU82_18320 [Arthrobacter sp. SW1]|uniref:hypothetical protein n=1 Tax=Arthrobacter sp. SW1 TaxID=1920889 RepID=UPI000877D7A6|nr:hypothetical protein [Arthrobacter sp. SW1]OFI38281.1 hypothetical protein BIU82_18320 [Arthrobacter sp. SW1]
MSAISGIHLGPWQTLFWSVLLITAVAATVLALRRSSAREPDAVFWNAFAGLVVIVPALLVPALLSPAVGLALLCLAAVTAAATTIGERKIAMQRQRQVLFNAAAARHRDILQRWQPYELDPGRQIDYPAMGDPRLPAIAALFRAMRRAESARIAADGGYPAAVEQLAQALDDAENAAGAKSAPLRDFR